MPKPYQAAIHFLSQIDDDWNQLIATVGDCQLTLKTKREPYEALVRAVAYQQLHVRAGDAIMQRFIDHYDQQFPSPEQLIATEFDVLRTFGFSGRKIETLYGVAKGVTSGIVPNQKTAEQMNNEDLIKQIIVLKGIGRWTVEMFLIFTLGRMDVMPADDFGVREGYKRLKSLETSPTPKILSSIAEAWQPYRTVAAWYLWQVPR